VPEKSSAIRTKTICRECLFEVGVIRRQHNLAYVANVFQFCKPASPPRTLAGTLYVTGHWSNAMSSCYEAFAVVCTSSQCSKQYLGIQAVQIGLHISITVHLGTKFYRLQEINAYCDPASHVAYECILCRPRCFLKFSKN